MKPELQRIAIAEACGWKSRETGVDRKTTWTAPDGEDWMPLPDYLSDLNAMAKVEETLTHEQAFLYNRNLQDINDRLPYRDGAPSGNFGWHSTAEQRAEAFLRTLGLWQDEPQQES